MSVAPALFGVTMVSLWLSNDKRTVLFDTITNTVLGIINVEIFALLCVVFYIDINVNILDTILISYGITFFCCVIPLFIFLRWWNYYQIKKFVEKYRYSTMNVQSGEQAQSNAVEASYVYGDM